MSDYSASVGNQPINIGQNVGSPIITGHVSGNVQGQININKSSESEYKIALAEVLGEILRLLKNLESTNPGATETQQVQYVDISVNDGFKQRALNAVQQGGEAAIDEFVLENKYLKVIKAIIKGWLSPIT